MAKAHYIIDTAVIHNAALCISIRSIRQL